MLKYSKLKLYSINLTIHCDNRKGGEILKLREIRKRMGITQGQLAEMSNVHRVSISRYESGKKKPNVDSLKRLADALHVSTDELLGGAS